MIIGIDLGTTYSLASYYDGTTAKLIPNPDGSFLTPSQVHFHKDNPKDMVVGEHPNDPAYTCTLSRFKENMGKNIQYHTKQGTYSPVLLSAMVLKQLKQDAEAFLGEEVTEAIISVPAYFNDDQRTATRDAGQLAGLNTTRLVNEPSAAALAYQFGFDEASLMVIDFGGGTFDVSIVDCFDNIIEILAINGDNQLGGNYVNDIIGNYLHENYQIHLNFVDVEGITNLFHKTPNTKTQEERDYLQELIIIKETLEQEPVILYQHKDKEIPIRQRDILVLLEEYIFEPIRRCIKQAMLDSKKTMRDIDHVILVGGSSKLTGFPNYIRNITGKTPKNYLNPQTVVALGMGYYVGIKSRHQQMKNYILTDVCPYSLGVSCLSQADDGELHTQAIIHRNSSLPAMETAHFTNIHHNQKEIIIEIYQGEEYFSQQNLKLGEIIVPLRPAPAGESRIAVTFSYDLNGILGVEVEYEGNSSFNYVESSSHLHEEQRKTAIQQLESLNLQQKKPENHPLIRRAKAYYATLGREEMEIIRQTLEELRIALRGSKVEQRKMERKMEYLLDSLDKWEKEEKMDSTFSHYLFDNPDEEFSLVDFPEEDEYPDPKE